MKLNLMSRQITLLICGLVYFLMMFNVPMASGAAVIIAVVFAPTAFGISLLLMLIQKIMSIFNANKLSQQIFFVVSLVAILGFTFVTFPYA